MLSFRLPKRISSQDKRVHTEREFDAISWVNTRSGSSPNHQQGRYLLRPGLREIAMKRFNVNMVVNKAIYTSLFTSAIMLFISGFAFTPAALAAELVINGGFEDPVVTSPKNWTTYFGGKLHRWHCDLPSG